MDTRCVNLHEYDAIKRLCLRRQRGKAEVLSLPGFVFLRADRSQQHENTAVQYSITVAVGTDNSYFCRPRSKNMTCKLTSSIL